MFRHQISSLNIPCDRYASHETTNIASKIEAAISYGVSRRIRSPDTRADWHYQIYRIARLLALVARSFTESDYTKVYAITRVACIYARTDRTRFVPINVLSITIELNELHFRSWLIDAWVAVNINSGLSKCGVSHQRDIFNANNYYFLFVIYRRYFKTVPRRSYKVSGYFRNMSQYFVVSRDTRRIFAYNARSDESISSR